MIFCLPFPDSIPLRTRGATELSGLGGRDTREDSRNGRSVEPKGKKVLVRKDGKRGKLVAKSVAIRIRTVLPDDLTSDRDTMIVKSVLGRANHQLECSKRRL